MGNFLLFHFENMIFLTLDRFYKIDLQPHLDTVLLDKIPFERIHWVDAIWRDIYLRETESKNSIHNWKKWDEKWLKFVEQMLGMSR